jgi:chromosome segregation ATPase
MNELDRRLSTAINGVQHSLEIRLNAIDKATDKFEANLVRVPTDVDKQVGGLKALVDETFRTTYERIGGLQNELHERLSGIQSELHARRELENARFDSVSLQFAGRDTALAAALAAQKESAAETNKTNLLAINKSENATADTLNKQADLFRSTTDALSQRIDSNKEFVNRLESRLTTIESRGVVVRETQTQTNWGISTMLAAMAVLISLVGLIVVLIKLG